MNLLKDGRASICTWSLTASFLTKEQATIALGKIAAEDVDFSVSLSKEHSDGRDHFVLEIHDMSWAHNLATVAQILDEVDFKDGT